MSAVDPTKLVSVSNQVAATLAREPTLDVSEALHALVETGRLLHQTLDGVVKDQKFWDRLTTAEPPEGWPPVEQWSPEIAAFLGAEEAAILELLGYQPPPPAQEFVNQTIEAIERLSERPPVPDARAERVEQARAALGAFNGRLEELLQQRGLEPPARRRRRLRAMLVKGAKVVLTVAPVALGYAAKAATALIAPHLADQVGDVIKDVAMALAVPLADKLISLLPDAGSHMVEVGAMLEQLDPRTKARALASVVLNHLLHLKIENGGAVNPSAKANLDAAIDLASAAGRRAAIAGFAEAFGKFETSLSAFAGRPSEARLQAAINTWRTVQDTFDSPEADANVAAMLETSETARKRWEASEANRKKSASTAKAETSKDRSRARQQAIKAAAAEKRKLKPRGQ